MLPKCMVLIGIACSTLLSLRTSAQILYTDYEPDLVATNAPQGNTDSVLVDVDQDGQADLILVSTSYFVHVHSDCCWNYLNQLIGIQPLSGMARNDSDCVQANCCRLYLDGGTVAGSNYNYVNVATFSKAGPATGGWCGPPSNTTQIYPFRVDLGGDLHYGWFRIHVDGISSISILDCALNMQPDSSIVVGDQEHGPGRGPMLTISVFPNPAREQITIATNTEITGSAELFDLLGKKLFEMDIVQSSSSTIQIGAVPPGAYYLKIRHGDHYSFSKVVVQR